MSMDERRFHTPRDSLFTQAQYDKIYRYCYFRLHNRELAEDITQEAFLRYWERYRFASRETTLKYLYTIARNLCIDEYRKPAVLSLEETLSAGGRTGKSTDPDTAVPSGEDAFLTTLAFRRALQKLAPEEQELLLLRYVNEAPVGVIAALFGISRFALRRRLLAAGEKLKTALEKEDLL